MNDELTERQEWLEWRRAGIGASDVAALCGMSQWASPMSVWADKMGHSQDDDNDILEFGRRAEPMLTGYFEDRTGLLVMDQQAKAIHPDHDHHRATLDGIAAETTGGDPLGVVEYKTAGPGTEKQWADDIPDQYAIQVQWQMHVSGLDHAWFGTLHGRVFRVYELDRDDRAIAMLTEVVDQFWHDHVLTTTPPPADGHKATGRALAEAFPEQAEGESASLDGLKWAIDLKARAAEMEKQAKADKAKADNAIKAALGDAEYGTLQGERVFSWRQTERAGHYVKPSTGRTLRKVGGSK